jgi:hypothetical protein
MGKHYSITDMQEYASYHGGKCLSKEYIDLKSPMTWRCEKGHTWDTGFRIIQQGGWCPVCEKKQNNEARLKELKLIAKERGGKCVSAEYTNSRAKLKFKCSEGHIWMMNSHSIKAGQWCPKCGIERRSEKRRNSIVIFQNIALKRGGKLLSENYKNGHSKLLWECSEGHQWYADGAMVLHAESWCPYCAGLHKTIKDMQILAEKRGGKCLSAKYIDASTKLKWKCSKGHIWETAPYNILDNCWCPTCGTEIMKEKEKDDIEKYRKVATRNGGKLLSETYVNNRTPLLWECKKGHARPVNVFHAESWCPYCYGNVKGMSGTVRGKG